MFYDIGSTTLIVISIIKTIIGLSDLVPIQAFVIVSGWKLFGFKP
jgi:hypothetical protein